MEDVFDKYLLPKVFSGSCALTTWLGAVRWGCFFPPCNIQGFVVVLVIFTLH